MKRRQLTLSDKLHEHLEQAATEDERTATSLIRAAIEMFLYVRQHRHDGWRFFRERDGEKVEVNWR